MAAVALMAEELAEPEHVFDVGLRGIKPYGDAMIVPVVQHAEETAGDVFDMCHVNADVAVAFMGDDSREWIAYTVEIGHNRNLVQFRSCCFNWADQDAYEAEEDEKGFNANWNENVDQYVDHYHRYFERIDWENSNWPDEGTDGPYYGVTSWTVKQGAGPAANQARIKLSDVALNQGWSEAGRNWLWLQRIGGKPMTAVVTSFSSYADMEPPEQSFFEFVGEKLGAEEAAAVFGAFGSGFTSSDYTVWLYNEAMSSPSDDE